MPKYTVKRGDCLSSIAYKHGFFEKTLWDHPENARLKQERENPNVLYTGDVVFIPEKREKVESGVTERRHIFRRKGVPARLSVRLIDEAGEPRANLFYLLTINGSLIRGSTDEDGYVEQPIPPDATKGKLIVGEEGEVLEYDLFLGELDPLDLPTGIRGRLENLGFAGSTDEATVAAFQERYGLKATGTVDEATRKKLGEIHDDKIGEEGPSSPSSQDVVPVALEWVDSKDTEDAISDRDNEEWDDEEWDGNTDARDIQF